MEPTIVTALASVASGGACALGSGTLGPGTLGSGALDALAGVGIRGEDSR